MNTQIFRVMIAYSDTDGIGRTHDLAWPVYFHAIPTKNAVQSAYWEEARKTHISRSELVQVIRIIDRLYPENPTFDSDVEGAEPSTNVFYSDDLPGSIELSRDPIYPANL